MSIGMSMQVLLGVPLLKLCEITTEIKEVQLTNILGEFTGEQITVIYKYLETPTGHKYLMSTNKSNIGSESQQSDTIYLYEELFADEAEPYESDWLHRSHSDCELSEVIIGLYVNNSRVDAYGDDIFGISIIDDTVIEETRSKVGKYLFDRFGYTGKVYLISQLIYY